METFLTYVGIPTSILASITLIIKAIELMRTSRIERLLLSVRRRITILIIETTIFALSAAFPITCFIFIFEPDKKIEVFVAIYIILIGLSLIFVLTLHFFINLYQKKKHYFYVEDKLSNEGDVEKWYIHKLTIDQDVILSKERDFKYLSSNVVLQKKEYLYGKMIKSEQGEKRK